MAGVERGDGGNQRRLTGGGGEKGKGGGTGGGGGRGTGRGGARGGGGTGRVGAGRWGLVGGGARWPRLGWVKRALGLCVSSPRVQLQLFESVRVRFFRAPDN